MHTSTENHERTVSQLRALDHGKAIEVAETLCSLVPYSNITLQNIKPGIMPKDFAPHGADCLKKEYVNGSTLFVYLLPF